MDDQFEPMYGNVYTVFDYILSFFGGFGNILGGLQQSLGGFLSALNPFA